jgi:tRNA(Ile)-lysidine synthase
VLLDAAACGLDRAQAGRLWVDSAQPGDVMCPLGMHGQSKKLSDLLGEATVPASERHLVPVVRTRPQGSVVWVAGIRPDERVRSTPDTRLLLELVLTSE